MAKYIDAGKIKFSGQTFDDGIGDKLVLLDDVRSAIEQTPTEDVVPVVHAFWKRNDVYRRQVNCSNCNAGKGSNKLKYSMYCGHCGARMDGEQK